MGQCAVFTWRTENTDGVNLYRSGQQILGDGNTDSSFQDCPPGPGVYDYTLDAYGNGRTSQTVTVEVSAIQPR